MKAYNRKTLARARDLEETETTSESLAATALSLDCLLADLHPTAHSKVYDETLTACKELLECECAYETLAELETTDSHYLTIREWVDEALAAVYC